MMGDVATAATEDMEQGNSSAQKTGQCKTELV